MFDSFAKLYAENQRAIYAIVRSLCPDPHDADDIFQQTTVVLWRKMEQFEPGTSFLAWATSIARYEVLVHSRKRARSKLVFDDELVSQIADRAVTHAEGANLRLEALRKCLQSLSQQHRSLIEQRYSSGESVSKLAAGSGRSAGALSVMLHSIRRKLLGCIEQRIAGKNA